MKLNLITKTSFPVLNNYNKVKSENTLVKKIFWKHWEAVFIKYAVPRLPDDILYLWKTYKVLFKLSFMCHTYNGILFISRYEAVYYEDVILRYGDKIDQIYHALLECCQLELIFNHTINRFIFSWHKIKPSNNMIAHNQFQCDVYKTIHYKDGAFSNDANQINLLGNKATYDLHDFAHIVSTSCEPFSYGCYYNYISSYIADKRFRSLISNPINKIDEISLVADGFVYTDLSRYLYDELVCRYSNVPDKLEKEIAKEITAYLLAEGSLYSHKYEKEFQLSFPISTKNLCILIFNKMYENAASEVERFVFVRVSDSCKIENLSPSGKLKEILYSDFWLYPEARNTIRHRAHRLSYINTAKLLSTKIQADINILEIISNFDDAKNIGHFQKAILDYLNSNLSS